MPALISGLVALLVVRHKTKASEKKFKADLEHAENRLRQEFAVQYSAEAAIKALMSKGFALRSFSLIQHHIRGFDEQELRKLLISSGCICFKVIDGKEYWGLLKENESLLSEREAMENKDVNFMI